jgi:uncharacterized protein
MRAIDCWVNVNQGGSKDQAFMQKVRETTFRNSPDFFKNFEADELVAHMDAHGVEKAVLTIAIGAKNDRVIEFTDAYPDRFGLGCYVNPHNGMKDLWELEAIVEAHPVVTAKITPFTIDLPPSAPEYWPVYAKCVELDLPIAINTGVPGPPKPADVQDPLHLDRALIHFPELTVIMAHGADPWWGMAIRLMRKYAGLHLMTSAWRPKYLPAELVTFMNSSRGIDKILWASDHPVLPMERPERTRPRRVPLRKRPPHPLANPHPAPLTASTQAPSDEAPVADPSAGGVSCAPCGGRR